MMTLKKQEPKTLKNLESLTDNIGRALINFRKYCRESGMKDVTIDALMVGKSVIECNYCKTFNMYEINHNERDKWKMYQCGNKKCDKTWLQFDENE